MRRAAFEIKQNPTGNYYFTFKSSDERTHVISGIFPDRAELEWCLSRVRGVAAIADICIDTDPCKRPPYFWIQPKEDGILFSLIGFKGEIIFSSIPYSDETLCREAIDMLKASSQKAAIVDLTVE